MVVSAAMLQLAPAAVADPLSVGPGDQVVEAAQAHEAGVPSTAAALVDAASPVGSVDLTKTSGGFVAQDSDGSSVEIDKSGEVTLSAPGVPDIGLSVAGAEGRSVVADGAAVRPEAMPSTDVVTRATNDGVQIVAVLNDENAPDTISFPVDLPEGGHLVAQPDGGVLVQAPVQVETVPETEANRVLAAIEAITGDLDTDSELTDAQIAQIEEIPPAQTVTKTEIQTIGEIEPAWAMDANGNPVKTRYEIDGDTIKQIVDTDGAAFPITADPSWAWWTWKIASCAGGLTTLAMFGPAKIASVSSKIYKVVKFGKTSKLKAAFESWQFLSKNQKDPVALIVKHVKAFVSDFQSTKGNFKLAAARMSSTKSGNQVQMFLKNAGTTVVDLIGLGSCFALFSEAF